MIMFVSLITIYGKKRKQTYELQALAEYIWKRYIISEIIIGIKRKNTSCECIHHIFAWSLHNNIPDKTGGKGTVFAEHFRKFGQLRFGRQFPEKKQIGTFFKTKVVVFRCAVNNIFDIVTAVIKFTVRRTYFSVNNFCGTYIRNFCKTN